MDLKDTAVLQKMIGHIDSIQKYCRSCQSLTDFEEDTMRVEATVFNLMQIGEPAKQSLSDEAKQSLKTIPWEQIYGLRNRIVHGYSGVNMQIVWDTVQSDLPQLREELKSYLV